MHKGQMIEVGVLAIQQAVFFPNTVIPLHVIDQSSIMMVQDAIAENKYIAVTLVREQMDHAKQHISRYPSHICAMGKPVIIGIETDGALKVMLEGVTKIKLIRPLNNHNYSVYNAEIISEEKNLDIEKNEEFIRLKKILFSWIKNNIYDMQERALLHKKIVSSAEVIDYIGLFMVKDIEVKQILLETDSIFLKIKTLSLLFKSDDPFHENQDALHILKNFEQSTLSPYNAVS